MLIRSHNTLLSDNIKFNVEELEDGTHINAHGDLLRVKNGKLHCDYAPALIYRLGESIWWYDGLPHRADGPAIIYKDGRVSWYWHGRRCKSLLNWAVRSNTVHTELFVMLKLKYG